MINENPELKDVFPEPPMAALRQGPPNSPKYQEIPNEHHTETQLDGRDAVNGGYSTFFYRGFLAISFPNESNFCFYINSGS